MVIVYSLAPGPGWHPVTHMVRLAAELLEATVVTLPGEARPGLPARLASLRPRRRDGEPCLLVCAGPPQIETLLLVERWRQRFGPLVAWVIDSFWTGWIPWTTRIARHVDRYFVTNEEEVEEWRRRTRTPTACLPWGTDALRLGSAAPDRPVDLLRFGRQPPGWEDDGATAAACQARGLSFAGRPAGHEDATEGERMLMGSLARAKFTLSFTNRVSPSVQTHPTREYLTARWVDALAAGATVAGIPPRCRAASELLWPGALLDLGTTDRDEGLAGVAEAVRDWTPERARTNRRRALERLDWRWSLRAVADALGLAAAPLRADLERIREALRADAPPGAATAPPPAAR
jgi:hypothetical protein